MTAIVYPIPAQRALAGELAACGVDTAGVRADRFSNGELHIEIEQAPEGLDVTVLGAVAPPDDNMLTTLLLAHTLKKEGARHVTACLPYLGYARHDRAEVRKSRATAWLGAVARASGIDAVLCVDVHSALVHDLFPMPVRSLSPAPLLATGIADVAPDAVLVAPDAGARERAEAVRQAAGVPRALVQMTKTRTPDGVRHATLSGRVTRHAVLVDDILDTGGTLLAACEALQHAGASDITIMATHGLFTGSAWQRLWTLGVTRIYVTDTVPLRADMQADTRIVVLPVARLLASVMTGAAAAR